MESNWAAQRLEVIRTLMERAAIYRRALAPVMIASGGLGTLAAAAGLAAHLEEPRTFILYWMAVAMAAVAGSFLLVRRQALKEAEPFWSPPTRRVAQALAPALCVGLGLGLLLVMGRDLPGASCLFWLPPAWIALYGCSLHAAGFSMPRGMKIFGWALVVGSGLVAALWARGVFDGVEASRFGHGVMGLVFGLAHLAYGAYLYATERSGNET